MRRYLLIKSIDCIVNRYIRKIDDINEMSTKSIILNKLTDRYIDIIDILLEVKQSLINKYI